MVAGMASGELGQSHPCDGGDTLSNWAPRRTWSCALAGEEQDQFGGRAGCDLRADAHSGVGMAALRGRAHHKLSVACASSLNLVCGLRRGNLEDALQKLQSFIDRAALDVQPIESDPVKQKKLAKQCVLRTPHVCWRSDAVRVGCCSMTGRAVP